MKADKSARVVFPPRSKETGLPNSRIFFVYEMWEQDGRLKQLEKLGIPDSYIDWEAIARDWFISDFHSVEIGYKETYVFSRH